MNNVYNYWNPKPYLIRETNLQDQNDDDAELTQQGSIWKYLHDLYNFDGTVEQYYEYNKHKE